MPCQICGAAQTVAKCIICEREVCSSCVVYCPQRDSDICDQKAGSITIYHCPGTYCPPHAKEELIFTCKDCHTQFCRSPINNWAKACPVCKDYICGNCYQTHIKNCTDYYDKEEALEKLYKLIEGEKQK